MKVGSPIITIVLLLSGCSDFNPKADIEPNGIGFQKASFSDGSTIFLGKQLLRKREKLVIHYRQDGSPICVDRAGLHFNPSMRISERLPWRGDELLITETGNVTYEEFQKGSYRADTSYNPTQYLQLRDRSGKLVVELEDFFRSKKPPEYSDKIAGYVGISFFRCDELKLLATGGRVPLQSIGFAVKFER